MTEERSTCQPGNSESPATADTHEGGPVAGLVPLTIDYAGSRIRLWISPQEFAYTVAPLFLVMAGTGRISILQACKDIP